METVSFRENIKNTIKVLKVIYRLSKGYLYSFIGQSICKSILPYISIFFTYLIIDGIIFSIPQSEIMAYVYWMIGLNLFVGILSRIFYYINQTHWIELSYALESNIAMKSFSLDYGQIEDNETMDLIQKAIDGSNGNGGLKSYTEEVLSGILTSILSVFYGLYLFSGLLVIKASNSTLPIVRVLNNPYSILIIFIAFSIPTIISYIVMKKDNIKSYQVMIGNIDNNRRFRYFHQICSNYQYGKDIRLFKMQDMILDTMRDDKYNIETNWLDYVKFNIRMMVVSIFGNKFLTFVAYMFVGLKAYYGLITVGNVFAYVGAITLVSLAVTSIIKQYSKIHLYNSYLGNYFTFLEMQSSKTYGEIDTLDYASLVIECKEVSFAYPNSNELILKNINLTIKPYEKLAIVGLNGAGKTTLIKLLCRLYEPTSGEIYLNGVPITSYTKDVIDKLYAVVFQDFKLFSYSVKENVSGGQNANQKFVWDTLNKAGIGERVEKMDDKIDTILYQRNTKNGVEISGGEAQKIAIARALYKNSPIVILDEPTAALDPKSEAEIYEKFQYLVENKISVFISHRMSSCKFCDRIIVMDDGNIVEEGSHQNLVSNKGLYEKMWTAQAKYYN